MKKSTIVRIMKDLTPTASRVAPSISSAVLARLFITPMRFAPPQRELAWIDSARTDGLGHHRVVRKPRVVDIAVRFIHEAVPTRFAEPAGLYELWARAG